ncbi:MAG: NAD(P)-binding protein [Deltaproteobacteria bacterium]|nr:NAD(P)-binding protein [Deltaproteobacteria bacterium]
MGSKPIRVAVVGGGCAALTTAFELTQPRHQGRYEVTVYQVGWRLGGKGASGRGPSARIEEHGLHLWMGFYENAFRLMRDCYEELGRDPASCPLATWQDAFKPAPLVGIADHTPPAIGSPGGRCCLQWTDCLETDSRPVSGFPWPSTCVDRRCWSRPYSALCWEGRGRCARVSPRAPRRGRGCRRRRREECSREFSASERWRL